MRAVVWTEPALRDLQGIRGYIGQFNPTAAQRIGSRLRAAGDSLAELSDRGRPAGRYREITAVWPYVLRYRVAGDSVVIMRVRHGKQRPES
jgi:toxin ParE1/3/4